MAKLLIKYSKEIGGKTSLICHCLIPIEQWNTWKHNIRYKQFHQFCETSWVEILENIEIINNTEKIKAFELLYGCLGYVGNFDFRLEIQRQYDLFLQEIFSIIKFDIWNYKELTFDEFFEMWGSKRCLMQTTLKELSIGYFGVLDYSESIKKNIKKHNICNPNNNYNEEELEKIKKYNNKIDKNLLKEKKIRTKYEKEKYANLKETNIYYPFKNRKMQKCYFVH